MKEKKRIGHDDRINLQAAIAKGWTLAQTAKLLSKSRSTVYREILGNLTYKVCRHSCSHCAKSCSDRKRYYDCVDANALSVGKRHEPRTSRGISDEDVVRIDSTVSEGAAKGQSLHHRFESDASLKAICCERTVRRYVYAGYLSVKARQLPRYVRFSHKYGYSERKTAMYAKKAGVKVIKLHEFLLSCVSNLLANGLSVRVVAHWVGDTERTVQETYSHLLPSEKDVIKDFFGSMSPPNLNETK